MGNGIHGSQRPPGDDAHKPYIQTYQAVGGWQSQCVCWMGSHWDLWDTGGGPYAYESDARKDARAWAEAWGLELRLPSTAPDGAPAPGLLDDPLMLELAAKGALSLRRKSGTMAFAPPRNGVESSAEYRRRLLVWAEEG